MMTSFDPSLDGLAFRDALGRFATGITVVTCQAETGPLGITANSFASVSLDPPLVLWSPAKASSRFAAFHAARHFAIHVLSADQMPIARAFAKQGQAFDHADWAEGTEGVPLIEGCLARFECRQAAAHDAGDHVIIVGQVTRVSTNPGLPVLFHRGQLTAPLTD